MKIPEGLEHLVVDPVEWRALEDLTADKPVLDATIRFNFILLLTVPFS